MRHEHMRSVETAARSAREKSTQRRACAPAMCPTTQRRLCSVLSAWRPMNLPSARSLLGLPRALSPRVASHLELSSLCASRAPRFAQFRFALSSLRDLRPPCFALRGHRSPRRRCAPFHRPGHVLTQRTHAPHSLVPTITLHRHFAGTA